LATVMSRLFYARRRMASVAGEFEARKFGMKRGTGVEVAGVGRWRVKRRRGRAHWPRLPPGNQKAGSLVAELREVKNGMIGGRHPAFSSREPRIFLVED